MGKCAKNARNLMRPYLSVINVRMKMFWFNYFLNLSTGFALRVEGDQASFCHQGTEKRCRVRRWWCGVYNGGTKSPGFSHKTSLPHSPSFCLPVPGIRERAIVVVSTSCRDNSPASRVDSPASNMSNKRELYVLRRGRLQERDFPNIMLCARANQRNLAGKYGSRCQSTTSFSENVVVARTSDQMLEILSFLGVYL